MFVAVSSYGSVKPMMSKCDSGRPDSTLVEVHPETGRTHQIRVHLANALHPVLGDTTYAPRGGQERAYHRTSVRHGFRDRLALHAWKIRFTPPSRRTPMEITAPPPPELARLMTT
jgi:23S rRNA-/tRNA-specific pseudouridylate synthase